MIANMLLCINPLLNEPVTIFTESDLEVARRRPSWIRAVSIETDDPTIGVAALALDGLRSIECTVALPLAPLLSSRTLKVLELRSDDITNDTIARNECIATLENLSLYECKQVTSVTSLATSKSLRSALSSRRRSC